MNIPHKELIDQIDLIIQKRNPAQLHGQLRLFAQQYLRHVPPEDLLARSSDELYSTLMSQWNWLQIRPKGEAIVRIFNPTIENHGWHSSHTMIEVVTDDMPFLVDSINMELNRLGITVHLTIYPVMSVMRDEQGHLEALTSGDEKINSLPESMIHIEADHINEETLLAELSRNLYRILRDIRAAVEDWHNMRNKLVEIAHDLVKKPPCHILSGKLLEDVEFLNWLGNHHFTLLGYRHYTAQKNRDGLSLTPERESGLGILRDEAKNPILRFAEHPNLIQKTLQDDTLLVITKTHTRSNIHRPVYQDFIGIKEFDANGQVIGEHRFIGLYTSRAYYAKPQMIPAIRHKFDEVMQRSGVSSTGHAGKTLINILETLPRDDLFHATVEELYEIAIGILNLQERQRIKLFIRRDEFGGFFSCLVFVPRDQYTMALRQKMEKILSQHFQTNDMEFVTSLSESPLARIHFIFRSNAPELPQVDRLQIEQQLISAARSWQDELRDGLIDEFGEDTGSRFFFRYRAAFPPAYQDDFSATVAAHDIALIEQASEEHPAMLLYQTPERESGTLQFKLLRKGSPIHLSDVMPMLENMNLRVEEERPYDLTLNDGMQVFIHDFSLRYSPSLQLNAEQLRDRFQHAFAHIWSGHAENDSYNRLIINAGLSWRECNIIRAYSRYLRLTGFAYSNEFIQSCVLRHANITALLVEIFVRRFSLKARSEQKTQALIEQVQNALEAIPNLEDDTTMRWLFRLIMATTRTNYFRDERAVLSVKFDHTLLPELPRPQPRYEIFIYSTRFEAVHLRGGKVARGGIRWSDRLEDFRTEILGLMKAQMVKNAVIVPIGAKGGFIVKQAPKDNNEELAAEVKECYQLMITSLLDLTDNIEGQKIIPPANVKRLDDDDPYLVVAADKGTASFSDLANNISLNRQFWLGDAFASGGSSGYDHKKMGITARGAWESVMRHARELGFDTQTTPFTVVGIGDMSGDVFGNGMLLSDKIRLLAAFDHRHIFLDPDPVDCEASFAERKRLFALPRSSWDDYDRNLISAGGGIYARTSKSIPVSPQVRKALDIQASHLSPNELIQAILQAPADLLWNGGIGTYVKASFESHLDAGDKSNDNLRVDAITLRCKMIGEGGNLGMTQAARIEYALNGGRLNTDFIDNSAGVDSSDHEVNIKILLNQLVKQGDLTLKHRNILLKEMTEEVAHRVLRHNYLQSQTLSVSQYLAPRLLDNHRRIIHGLEKRELFNRKVEKLPSDEELKSRKAAGLGLTRPELAVLLSHSKLKLFDELLHSSIHEDPRLRAYLQHYFPAPIRERYCSALENHPLRTEIICTQLANDIIDRLGIGFVERMVEETGASTAHVIKAYEAVKIILNMQDYWHQLEALDGHIEPANQAELFILAARLVTHNCRWLLQHSDPGASLDDLESRYRDPVSFLLTHLPLPEEEENLPKGLVAALEKASEAGPGLVDLTRRMQRLFPVLDLAEAHIHSKAPLEDIANQYYAASEKLGFDWLYQQINHLPYTNHWQSLARAALRDQLYHLHSHILRDIYQRKSRSSHTIESWLDSRQSEVDTWLERVAEMKAHGTADLAMLTVGLRELNILVGHPPQIPRKPQ